MTIKVVNIASANEVWSYSFDQRRQVYSADMVQTVRALSDIFQSQMNVVVGQLDSLFLAESTGLTMDDTSTQIPRIIEQRPDAPADSAKIKIDESSFEIIREKQ